MFEVAKGIKESFGDDVRTIMGGPHPTFNSARMRLRGETLAAPLPRPGAQALPARGHAHGLPRRRRGGRGVARAPRAPRGRAVARRRAGHRDALEPPPGRHGAAARPRELPRRPSVPRPPARLREDAAEVLRDADVHLAARLPVSVHVLLQREVQRALQAQGQDDQPLQRRPAPRGAARHQAELRHAVHQVLRRHVHVPRGRLAARVLGEVPEGHRRPVPLPDAVRPRPQGPGDDRPHAGRGPALDHDVDRVRERVHPAAHVQADDDRRGDPVRVRLLREEGRQDVLEHDPRDSRARDPEGRRPALRREGGGRRRPPRDALPAHQAGGVRAAPREPAARGRPRAASSRTGSTRSA